MSALEQAGGEAGSVRLVIDGAVAAITFDRPAARNAMTWGMYEALQQHCERLKAEPGVRVVTFRGAGGDAFVAGTDIAQFAHFKGGEDGVAYERQIDAAIGLLESLPMPTVAVIEGWTIGGGLAIATACDFRLATPTSHFGVPIARTLGNCLSVANLARLEAAFGLQAVRRMLLLAETLTADEAHGLGFLHEVVPPDALDAAAEALCQRLAVLAPVTQRVSKEGLRRVVAQRAAADDDLVRLAYGSQDFHEGVAAFTAKRKPVWRGH